MKVRPEVRPATGKLGVLTPGLGAVASTFVAGVEAVRRGLAQPIGSVTQMQTIRLGKRHEGRSPLVKDFVPLAGLEDLVFGAWDPVPDNGYQSALKAGVLDKHEHVNPLKNFLEQIKPMPAAFDTHYVKKLDGTNVKEGKNKRDLAEQIRADIRRFKSESGAERLVMVWCGSTEIFIRPGARARNVGVVREGDARERREHRTQHAVRVRSYHGGDSIRERSAQPIS